MFENIKSIRRLKFDAAKVKIPGDLQRTETGHVKRRALTAIRVAACMIAAAVLIVSGAPFMPGRQIKTAEIKNSAKSAAAAGAVHDDFVLEAYAAVAPKGAERKIVLKPNINVTLITGKLHYNKHDGQIDGKWFGGSDFSQDGSFSCTGKNLVSVSYTAQSGLVDFRSEELRNQMAKASKNAIVCTIKIPRSKLSTGSPFDSFNKLWKSGGLDEYRSRYFNGGDIDLTRYHVTIKYFTGRENYSWGEGAQAGSSIMQDDEKLDTQTAYITISDSRKYNFNDKLYFGGKSFIVKANEHYAGANWDPSDSTWAGIEAADKRYEKTGAKDYSGVPGDTISVTGTFSDGAKVTKYIALSFDKNGSLCVKLKN